MLVILPPSETKVVGGAPGSSLELGDLSYPVLTGAREALLGELVSLAADEAASIKALKLGPKGAPEVARNTVVRESPTIPALSRYTGVLYDALDYGTLPSAASARAAQSLAVFSALFGLVGATDAIPAYRLSWDSVLPGGKPGTRFAPVALALWESVSGFVLDVRSEGYRSLCPVPPERGVFVSLVRPGEPGSRRSLGHLNKAAKGILVRELLISGAQLSSLEDFIAWGNSRGYTIEAHVSVPGVAELVIAP